MNYYLVMFQINPVPSGAPLPIKMKLKRQEYEVASLDDNATVIHEKGKFQIREKRIFSNEEEGSIYIIADVTRIKQ